MKQDDESTRSNVYVWNTRKQQQQQHDLGLFLSICL